LIVDWRSPARGEGHARAAKPGRSTRQAACLCSISGRRCRQASIAMRRGGTAVEADGRPPEGRHIFGSHNHILL
jgi:hypothetical protein